MNEPEYLWFVQVYVCMYACGMWENFRGLHISFHSWALCAMCHLAHKINWWILNHEPPCKRVTAIAKHCKLSARERTTFFFLVWSREKRKPNNKIPRQLRKFLGSAIWENMSRFMFIALRNMYKFFRYPEIVHYAKWYDSIW